MIDLGALGWYVEKGLVRRFAHPSGKLFGFNYTEQCTYEGAWDDVTRQCRGLIIDLEGNIVARPFAKFFNFGEPHAPDLDLDALAVVTDKMDGSLGIIYPDPEGGYAVATRGSFTSDQALHATEILRTRYAEWEPPPGATTMVEIIYPSNRIVVDYGDLDDLVFLACLWNGDHLPVASNWPGLRTEQFVYATLREALEATPRPGREGLVVWLPESDTRVKIKQEDYVRIHRLVFGLTARRIWQNAGVHDLNSDGLSVKQIGIALQMDPGDVQGIIDAAPDGDWMEELLMIVPEEFSSWATNTEARISMDVNRWEFDVKKTLASVVSPEQRRNIKENRREIAGAIQTQPKEIHGALFALLDNKPIRSFAWRAVKPEHETFRPEDS